VADIQANLGVVLEVQSKLTAVGSALTNVGSAAIEVVGELDAQCGAKWAAELQAKASAAVDASVNVSVSVEASAEVRRQRWLSLTPSDQSNEAARFLQETRRFRFVVKPGVARAVSLRRCLPQ
jgi:hypothetical protein